jgi:ribose transport system substrate-binding protein
MRKFTMAAACLLAAVALGACGSSDDTGAATATPETTAAAATAGATTTAADDSAAILAEDFKGIVDEPPTTSPKAQRNKTIWLSNCVAFEGCQRYATGMKAAAKQLGWTIKEVDNQANPAKSIEIIRQAIAAKADGVIDTLSDCPTIKAGLQAAKAAHMPVLTGAGLDCDTPELGGGEPLYAARFRLGHRKDELEYYREQGGRDAEFMIALAREKGIQSPKILQVQNHDQLFQKYRATGFADKVKEVCPDCEVKPLEFTTQQLASGKGQQVFKSGILGNPGMDALYYANDAFLAPGLQAALESNKGKFKVVCCGDGGQQGIANVRRSGDLAGTYAINYAPVEMWGWGVADLMNRVLAGEDPKDIPGEANVSLYIDPDHNLPPEGQPVQVPIDYESAYKQLWETGSR